MKLWKGCMQYASKLENSTGHVTGKGLFSFQSQRKAMTKTLQITAQFALISHASKEMLKILQARLQQYMNHELPAVQTGFRKGRGTRDQIANICWIVKKARERNLLLYWLCQSLYCMDHNKLWTILKEMELPDHLTCFLRNLYAGQAATVRTGHGTTDWFQIGKGVR